MHITIMQSGKNHVEDVRGIAKTIGGQVSRMDREEAIKILTLFREEWDRHSKTPNAKALDMAIEALQEKELDIELIVLLLSKSLELFKRQDESPYVLNLLEEIVYYDGVNCDGYCLMEDIENVLEDMRGEQE